MANTKISALPAASTLDGTETIPLVQGGTTVRTTISKAMAASENVNVVSTAGASQTLPAPSVATIHRLTLTSASCALTLPTPVAGQSFTLVLTQDATGGRLVTYTAAPKWVGGTAPTLSTGANKVDYLSFICVDGASWVGFVAGLDVH